MTPRPVSIGISGERWAPGEWRPENDAVDVEVWLDDGSRWWATFFAYAYLATLAEKNRATGECLGGRFFRADHAVWVDTTARERIEEVVAELLRIGEFESAFARVDPGASG